MTVGTAPAFLADMIDYLLGQAQLTALTATRIDTDAVAAWGLPADAITVDVFGGFGANDLPVWQPRFQFTCYGHGISLGQQKRNAFAVWQVLDAILMHPMGDGGGWRQGTTSVLSVLREFGPLVLTDPLTQIGQATASYLPILTRAA